MKTQTLLNIGLARKGKKDLNSLEVVSILEETIGLIDYAIKQSSTEKTLVALVNTKDVPDAFLYALSVVLGQDCIAALDDGRSGRLCGPKPWGDFDLSQFLTLNGASL